MKKLLGVYLILSILLSTSAFFFSPVRADENTRIDVVYADSLKELGLFIGTDQGFMLDKKLNRDEAAVMLVRLLGAEEEARSGEYDLPFSDVDEWAKPYVGWLYENKLTYGMEEKRFGSKSAITGQQYLTFLLRCLGYSEAAGDFTYNGVFEFIQEKDLLQNDSLVNFYKYYCPDFLRYDCTVLTFRALMWEIKGGERSLSDVLIEKGVFTSEAFIEQLWKFADSYGVNKEGKIVHRFGGGLDLPALGSSEESYDYTSWERPDFIFGFVETSNNFAIAYVVDAKTLERKSKLSEWGVSLLDLDLHNGLLYFSEWNPDSMVNQHAPVAIKAYDWKNDMVTDVLNCDSAAMYNTLGSNYYIAGEFGDKFEYRMLDMETGAVKCFFSEEADAMYAWYFSYSHDSSFLTASYCTLFKLFAGDEIHYYIYELDTLQDSLVVQKNNDYTSVTGVDSRKIFSNNSQDEPPYFFFDNDACIEISADNKMRVLYASGGSYVSAYKSDDGKIYVLAGEDFWGEELGVIENNGDYTVLVPEIIIKEMAVNRITSVDTSGNVEFIGEADQGMGHISVSTYMYNAEQKKVTVKSFTPGRSEFYTEDSIKQLLIETQKKLDMLQD